jgi:hypothetical protein
MTRISLIRVVWLFILLLVCGCAELGLMPRTLSTSIPVRKLLAAPEEVIIDGHRFILKTSIYRNLMNGWPPPHERGIITVIRVIARGSRVFPSSVDVDRVWIIGPQTWEYKLMPSRGNPSTPQNTLEKIANGNPCCPGHYVEVVVRLIDDSGHSYLLKASRQRIGAVF